MCGFTMQKFQSLFYWTSFKNDTVGSPRALIGCFNPCFIGLHSKTKLGCLSNGIWGVSFNPCFIGLHSKTQLDEMFPEDERLGFNPCFIGLHSKTFSSERYKSLPNEFQSLFYWTSFKNASSS